MLSYDEETPLYYYYYYYYCQHVYNTCMSKNFKNIKTLRASLVVQWLRICLPMQGTLVRALVREDPTCHRATKPVRHNY